MKCLNCGKINEEYLCEECLTEDVLKKIFNQIIKYNPETCENIYIQEYVSTLTEIKEERNCIPSILSLFSFEISEYYLCLFYFLQGDERFEMATDAYLENHEWIEWKSQRIIDYKLKKYIRNDFIKPRVYCDWIAETKGVYAELYQKAAMYYGMIGEYDLSDQMILLGLSCDQFLYTSKEKMAEYLEKQRVDTLRYRTKKPYWPKTEERQRAVAMFYDEKGIVYSKIKNKAAKVPENQFGPISECFDEPESYCAFWCCEAFNVVSAKPIYQIAAIKVENGEIIDEFESLIRPWDGTICRKDAAKKAGVSLQVIENADDVDIVMPKFFEFVGDAVLVSTGALGTQAKLISRAARYAGMKCILNEFFDILDYASDIDDTFDLENNNREYLLKYFSVNDGNTALEKATVNKFLYESLKTFGE